MEKQRDKRKNRRFKAREGSVAALNFEICRKAGMITDISRGGLAFRYLASEYEGEENSAGPSAINISCGANGVSLFTGPCKVVKDNYTPPEYSFCLGLIRKCSVQFGELTADQQSKLEYFITYFTKGSIKNRLTLPPIGREV